ncbi:YceH family protein [soil metagenome]
MDADAIEIRVLGCLIEKQRTTPDAYPLSLNSLRLTCNQATNRDPVVDYDEQTIRAALERLSRKGWTRLASGVGSRAAKYRHLFDQVVGVSPAELSLLAVLMLRGPQTPGELKQRSERLHPFASLEQLHEVLEGLRERKLVARLERGPGQKEERYTHLLGGDDPVEAVSAELSTAVGDERIRTLEERVGELENELASLRRESQQRGQAKA